MTEFEAFRLGFYECLRDGSGMGCTWANNQDLNEAYDRGMNLAEELFPQ